MKRIPLSKAKSILYRTRGVKSKHFPHGMEHEFAFKHHTEALSLPKGTFRNKILKKTRAQLTSNRRREQNLLKKLNIKKYIKDKNPIPF